MNPSSSTPIAPGLVLKVSAEDAKRLLGKWVVVDEDGNIKAVGTDFEDANQQAMTAGLDFSRVEFVCIPPPGLVG
jgi:hypothetical protein